MKVGVTLVALCLAAACAPTDGRPGTSLADDEDAPQVALSDDQGACTLDFDGQSFVAPRMGPGCRFSLDGAGAVRTEDVVNGPGQVRIVVQTTPMDAEGDCDTRMIGVRLLEGKVTLSNTYMDVAGCTVDDLDQNIYGYWRFD